jgi:hypothetical protein
METAPIALMHTETRKTEPDADWESIARDTQQKLQRAYWERDNMRDFLKWLLAQERIPRGLKALIVEALAGRFSRL